MHSLFKRLHLDAQISRHSENWTAERAHLLHFRFVPGIVLSGRKVHLALLPAQALQARGPEEAAFVSESMAMAHN